jgi:hypothetical protein
MSMGWASTRQTVGVLLTCVALVWPILHYPLPAASQTGQEVLGGLACRLEPSVWRSHGKAGFEGDNDTLNWELIYPLDGWMGEVRAEVRYPFTIWEHRFGTSLKVRYAHSIGIHGTSTDTDWDGVGAVSDYSECDCEADVIMWDLDATFFFRIPQERMPVALEVGGLAGYGVQRFDFTNTNLHVTISDYRVRNGHTPGVAAIYNTEIRTARVGLLLHIEPSENLRYYLEAVYFPYLRASADAYWVLRRYKFWQEAGGNGHVITFKADRDLWGRLSLFASIRQVSLVADQDALESGVIGGDRYEDEDIVSEITSNYFGLEMGIRLRF